MLETFARNNTGLTTTIGKKPTVKVGPNYKRNACKSQIYLASNPGCQGIWWALHKSQVVVDLWLKMWLLDRGVWSKD